MKLKTKNSTDNKTASPNIKNKSPKKQAKGVVKEKVKVVKLAVLKKEGEAAQKASLAQTSPNPLKALKQELWVKAIINVSAADLPAEESSVAKLLADYKKKESIPQYETKLKNFITKGFSKFKDTSSEVLSSVYRKFQAEFEALGGEIKKSAKSTKVDVKKSDSKVSKPKSKKESKVVVEEDDDEEDDEDIDDEDDDDDDLEGITFDGSDDSGNDLDEESEEEKPKAPLKSKNVKGQNGNSNNKGKNGSKFKGGKVQKKKPNKFNKKK
ncbi:DNA ligase 1-like [Adelges cooleyi]|uniref:DNA ligase 1-like n=1 Tax=Adelges cooleyi TaxID=133065 RepID=UPI00217F9FEF|nr:DNA ligase 1-like [Adelges cooleyi]